MNTTLKWTPGATLAEQTEHASRIASRFFSQAFSGLSRHATNRRVLNELAALSDRDLSDIGLARWDIVDAEAAAGHSDTSERLIARRQERLRAGRSAASRC